MRKDEKMENGERNPPKNPPAQTAPKTPLPKTCQPKTRPSKMISLFNIPQKNKRKTIHDFFLFI